MKKPIRIILLILGVIMLIKEGLLGLPVFGGLYNISLGLAPLGTNISLYILMLLITAIDRTNEARTSLSTIAVAGIIANAIAFIPIIGMFMHWLMFFLMIAYIGIVLSTREYRGNTTHYDRHRAGETVREYK
ncbi:hypothetical protein [Macrococcus capreoli]|uniref:hypothetical protein n=1 Tax=Macrococcus capreoli TaxID=2982690 RepID=UPI0021D60679|nr:hypothetical protein [Macrococcus sp. TMW 2.2395]MCU7557036.1 hypothetical protein [Macrococcus sp. TMW 2.2395]